MKKTRLASVLLFSLATAAGLALAAALFFPGIPARLAISAFAPRDWSIHFASLRGSPWTGYRARDLHVRGPGIDLTIGSLSARPDWRALLRREWIVESLDAEGPALRISSRTAPSPEPAAAKPALWGARRVRITDGTFWAPGAPAVTGIGAALSLSTGGVQASSVVFQVAAHTVNARGRASFEPLSWAATADIRGALEGTAAGSGTRQTWDVELDLAHPPGLTAAGRAEGERGHLKAAAVAEGGGPLGRGVSAKRLWLKAKAGGPMAAPAWNVDAGYEDLSVKDLRSKKGRLSASGKGVGPMKIDFQAEDTDAAGRRLDRARVSLDGTPAAHAVTIEGKGDGITASAHGRGRWAEGQWDATWKDLEARWKNVWRSTSPFHTTAAPGRLHVDDLGLVSEKGALRLDGVFRAGGLSRFHVRADGLALEPLHAHGWVRKPLAGTLYLDARLATTPAYSSGTATFRAEDLVLEGQNVGRLTGRVIITKDRLRWEKVELLSPAGGLISDGSVPWPLKPPLDSFHVRLRSPGFDPGPWLKSLFSLETKGALLTGDIVFSRSRNGLESRGQLRFAAEDVKVPSLGTTFRPVVLVLAGEGERLVVREGLAETKDGSVRLTGGIGRGGPDLALTGRRVPFRAGQMVGRADADLEVKGTWQRPLVAGKVYVRRAEDRPVKKKKKEKDAPAAPKNPPAAPSALAVDIALRADRDVWYKRGDTAVELKADVKIEKEPYDALRLYGTAGVVRGDYFFYGRRFKIEQGNALFAGESPVDPALSVRAVHNAGDIDVLLSVSGTLLRPQISLTSNPPLEETDIVSVLATGQTASALGGSSSAGDGAQAAAQGLVAGYLSGKLEDRLRQHVPLDVLRVDVGAEGEAGVTVGKNVTDRLYVAVEQTLGTDGERRLRSEYVLTDWLNLEGSSSAANYVVDLLFKFGFR